MKYWDLRVDAKRGGEENQRKRFLEADWSFSITNIFLKAEPLWGLEQSQRVRRENQFFLGLLGWSLIIMAQEEQQARN